MSRGSELCLVSLRFIDGDLTTIHALFAVGSLSCRGLFYVMLTSVIATVLGIYMMCQMTATHDEFCELGTMLVEQVVRDTKATIMNWVM